MLVRVCYLSRSTVRCNVVSSQELPGQKTAVSQRCCTLFTHPLPELSIFLTGNTHDIGTRLCLNNYGLHRILTPCLALKGTWHVVNVK